LAAGRGTRTTVAIRCFPCWAGPPLCWATGCAPGASATRADASGCGRRGEGHARSPGDLAWARRSTRLSSPTSVAFVRTPHPQPVVYLGSSSW